MDPIAKRSSYLYQADANAFGGLLQGPVHKVLDTLAPTSLPPVGGFARARSEAFNLDDIVRCSAAYTMVAGCECECEADGSVSTLATAVIEDLNILEVVTARRIVARVSVTVPKDSERRIISFAGSGYEGLRLGGYAVEPTLDQPDEDAVTWAQKRNQPTADSPHAPDGSALCSLVDSYQGGNPPGASGPVIEIPGFGRIFLAELLISPCSIQLITIRAELQCPIRGRITAPQVRISGGQNGGHA